jgi:exodeoxyribonuclease VII small subunit
VSEKKSGKKGGMEDAGGGTTESFETRLKDLEEIVAKLEREDVPLEESIALYEKGMVLHRSCEKILSEARLRIEKLSTARDEDGEGA